MDEIIRIEMSSQIVRATRYLRLRTVIDCCATQEADPIVVGRLIGLLLLRKRRAGVPLL